MFARSRSAGYAVPLLLAAAALAAARPGEPAPPPRPVAARPAVPQGVTAFVSVNVAEVWDHPAFNTVREGRGKEEFVWAVQSLVGVPPAGIARLTVFRHADHPDAPFVAVTGRKPLDPAAVVKLVTRPGGAPGPMPPAGGKVLVAPGAEFAHVLPLDRHTLLLASRTVSAEALEKLAAVVPGLTAAAGRHAIAVGADVPALAGLPLPVGGPLLDATAAVLTADLAAESAALRLTLTFPTADKARAATPLLRTKLDELSGWAKQRQRKAEARAADGTATNYPAALLDWIAATSKAAKVRADGAAVVAVADVKPDEAVAALLAAFPEASSAPHGDAVSLNNLKQIALAVHSYHDAMSHAPGNSYGKDGTPLLSWRVHILPYIEQQALYTKFKLDEPWDSPHNKPLGQTVVRVYQVLGRPAAQPWETYYQSFVGPKDVKPEQRPWLVEGEGKGPQLAKITDGTSNTLMVAEAAVAVPWAKPADIPYDAAKPVPKLGGASGAFAAAFGDGSARTFRRPIPEMTLRGLITIGGGEVTSIPD